MKEKDKITKKRLTLAAILSVVLMLIVIGISIAKDNNEDKNKQLKLEEQVKIEEQAEIEEHIAVDVDIASAYLKVSIGGNPTKEPQDLRGIQKWLDSNPYAEIIDILPDSNAFGVDGITIVYRKSAVENYYRVLLDENNFNIKDYVASTQLTNSANTQKYKLYLVIIKSNTPSEVMV